MKAYTILLIAALLISTSCDEDKILEEIPLDFPSPENSFVTEADFQTSINYLYSRARDILCSGLPPLDYAWGTDLAFNTAGQANMRFGSYLNLTPVSDEPNWHWTAYYWLVSTANTVLDRLTDADLSSEVKTRMEAEAKLFRGLAYRNLAHLYGGVPILTEEVKQAKTDFTRATRTETYEQAASDLKFAVENLPGITAVTDGKVSNLAASHMLAEVYVALQQWDNAITYASKVIDDPNTALMTERFGSRSSEPGDVFWDLFRKNNQNRSSGNTEAIWVWQYELDVPGGALSSTERTGCTLEREAGPMGRSLSLKDPGGVSLFLPTSVSDYSGAGGIGRCGGTSHFKYGIWRSDWNDMRNSQYNMIRDVQFNNPASQWYGEWFSDHIDYSKLSVADTMRRWYPYPSKITTPNNHPDDLYVDRALKTLVLTVAGSTYTDQYHIRLAETYLLRAEAYLGKGDATNAAKDINVVRGRANAIPVTPGEVDIDYILDERLRELNYEEKRRLTLNRLGLLYERTNKYCEGYPGTQNFGLDVQPHNNLFPIPYSEIESNTEAALEQNPGYFDQ